MPDMPEVESVFAMSQDGWWGGSGEPGGVTTPASVANAIFFATGKRIRELPLTPERVKVVLASPLIGTPLGTMRYPVDAASDFVN